MTFKKSSSIKLTKRELEIMNILWESDAPLIASDITKKGNNLTINTVQALLKKLLKLEYIKVADIVYSGTVLSRSYVPAISSDEYEMGNIMNSYSNISDKAKGVSRFVAAFLEDNEDPEQLLEEINELQALLRKKEQELQSDK